jgi:hypothetical protein
MNRRTARKLTIPALESLEDRVALTASFVSNPWEAAVDMKGGDTLGSIYTQYYNYVVAGSQGPFYAAQAHQVEMAGNAVGVNIQFGSGTLQSNETQMQQIGMLVLGTSGSGMVSGFMPIGSLLSVANDSNASSMAPVFRPNTGLTPGAAAIDPSVSAAAPTMPTTTTTSDEAAVALKGGPMLSSIYQQFVAYEQAGGTGTFSPTGASQVVMAGDAVGVNISTSAANYATMLSNMEQLGMYVTATAPQDGIIEGFIPIAQLPAVAANTGLTGLSPVYKPASR